MVLGYHGITTDPSTLNTWLINNKGYTSTGNIKWGKVGAYSGEKVSFQGFGGKDDYRLEKDICSMDLRLCMLKIVGILW